MQVAFQMDPVTAVDINADTTFRLAEEAQARGHTLYYFPPDRLRFENGRVRAVMQKMRVRRIPGDHVTLEAGEDRELEDLDVVWLRQDPPFDMNYITTTHLLDLVSGTTCVVNDPFWVRNYPEKLLVLQFPDLIPDTLVTRDLSALRAFKAKHGDIIVKPLYGNGGAGVFRLGPEDRNLSSLFETMSALSREQLIAQQYLPAIQKGDKRVILVDGEPVGAINRMPQAGETRSNMHVGGRAEPATLTDRDREICAAIGPTLREKGQVLVGIDVIGDYLTEINLTSPTGIQELERFDGTNVAGMIWDAVERRASPA